MMMESIGIEKNRSFGGQGWLPFAWLGAAAGSLLLGAIALAWYSVHSAMASTEEQAIVGALQVGARDVAAFSALAANGDAAAVKELRERSARLDAMLTVLGDGGKHEGKTVQVAADPLHTRMREFATRWAEFKRRTETLLLLASASQAQATKDANLRRVPERASAKPPAQKVATGGGAGPVVSAASVSLLNEGHALAAAADTMRAELDNRQPGRRWMLSLAVACALASIAVLTVLVRSSWRSGLARERAAEQSNVAMLEVLRPAMRTLHIHADASALADPQALGRRLSDEILVVLDGIKTLVKAVDAATAEADKFAVVGHIAAQALGAAEQKAAGASANLQVTARRISAVYTALSAGATEAQQQCAQLLQTLGTGVTTGNDAARLADQARDGIGRLSKRHDQIVALTSEIAHGFGEIVDRLMQAEGLALRASSRFAGMDEAVQFANDVRSYLGPSMVMLKQATELAQRAERESGDLSKELVQVVTGCAEQSRTAANGARVLDYAEGAAREMTAKISSMSRLASGPEAAQLVAALDEIVRQIAQSSASAREVLEATSNAANRIEELAKLLNTLKPA